MIERNVCETALEQFVEQVETGMCAGALRDKKGRWAQSGEASASFKDGPRR